MILLKKLESRTEKDKKNNLKVNNLNFNICKSLSINSDTTPKEPVWSNHVLKLSTKCNSSKKSLKILHVCLSSLHLINLDHHC